MNATGNTWVTDPVGFGRRVQQLRRQRGLKQSELAGGDISTAYVSRIESGQRRPEPKVVALLAERLGTTRDYLLTGVGGDEVTEARLALRYAELALHSGEAGEAETQVRRLLAASSDALGPLRPHARLVLARALENLGRLDDAIHELERLRNDGAGEDTMDVHLALSRCYRETGDLARSIDVGESGLTLAADLGLAASDDAVRLTVTLAAAYFERGDAAYAAHLCESALEQAELATSPPARAAALWNSSVIASERGQTELAVGLAERALALLGESTDERSVARLRLQHGALLLRRQPPDVEGAELELTRARDDLAQHGASAVDIARCDATMAVVRLHQGAIDEAERLATQARAAVADAPLLAAQCDMALGRARVAAGDLTTARRHYASAAAALTGAASDRGAAAAWFELAELLEDAGDADGARSAYRSAAASMGLRASLTPSRVPSP